MSAICNHFLRHSQQKRVYLLRCAGAQDSGLITLLKSSWLVHRPVLSGSFFLPGGGCGETRCSSSSVRRNPCVVYNTSVDSGYAQSIVQVWEEYFADPLQWWDNRVHKVNTEAPDFQHKETKTALWVDHSSTPPWVKATLKLVTQRESPSRVGYREIVKPKRSLKSNSGRINSLPTTARGSNQNPRGGGGPLDTHSAKTASEATAVLKNRLHEGISAGSYMYVDVLKRCLKQSDLAAVEQVHKCIIESGLQQSTYVVNNLVSAFIRCGGLEDACLVFDELVEKDVFSWTSVIGGYAQHGRAEDAMQVFNRMRKAGVQADAIAYLSILKAFASPSTLQWGKEVHACIRHGGFELDVRVGTAVLQMYVKCGSLEDARKTFDDLVIRNVFSWNVMIGAYAEVGCGEEAYRLFLQMRREGLTPNAVTYLSILKPCAQSGTSEWMAEVHRDAREAGFESDSRVGNALVHMYAKCGSIGDAQLVFDRMKDRNVITWTVMIGAYADRGCGADAYRLLLQMIQEGVHPDAVTYVSILSAFASSGSLEWVKKVHRHAREGGFESDVRVSNALAHMYAKCGSIDEARLVFDRMEHRDVRTWTVMIGGLAQNGFEHEAYDLILRMKREGLQPDAFTYASVLNACATAVDLEWLKKVHCLARDGGFESDLRVGNALVHLYAKCGSINDAQLVFDRMIDRDVVTWTVMVGAYAGSERDEEAYGLFLRMMQEGVEPSTATCVSVLNACASAGGLDWVKSVHRHARKGRFESDVRVGNALVHTYAKCGSIDDARLVFDRMEHRDVRTWTVMIGAYAEKGLGEDAYRLFLQMIREGFQPNAVTYLSILNAKSSTGGLQWVSDVHRHVRAGGFESDLRVGNALVRMYAKCGSIADAQLVFDRMEERNIITWTALIGAYAEIGHGKDAFRLFLQMIREGFEPNAFTYTTILNSCASAGSLEWVKKVHCHACEGGFESDVYVGNALIHMYAKCGSIADARLVFQRMEDRDVITWTVMIGGLAQHGCGAKAVDVFREMLATGMKPDDIAFVAVLSACSHAGLVDEGRHLFLSMSQDYGIVPSVSHWNCMVDILGRAGHLDEAKSFIDNMAVEPDGATWGSLLSACRSYGNVELGELAAKELVKLEPDDASAYVLLSNIYAAAEKWEEVSLVRTTMQERGIRTDPGRSWIEVGNKIHAFVVGDTSHPESKKIYAELSRLTEKIKAEGYLPETQLVLHDVDEKDKEFSLCSHSERLAIAYGLLSTPGSNPIRVFKNLRVCSDCHAATKLISKVTRKEIVVRDANRFHHFKDGLCSCQDYW